jgi:hypothetical protein
MLERHLSSCSGRAARRSLLHDRRDSRDRLGGVLIVRRSLIVLALLAMIAGTGFITLGGSASGITPAVGSHRKGNGRSSSFYSGRSRVCWCGSSVVSCSF